MAKIPPQNPPAYMLALLAVRHVPPTMPTAWRCLPACLPLALPTMPTWWPVAARQVAKGVGAGGWRLGDQVAGGEGGGGPWPEGQR